MQDSTSIVKLLTTPGSAKLAEYIVVCDQSCVNIGPFRERYR